MPLFYKLLEETIYAIQGVFNLLGSIVYAHCKIGVS